MAVQAEAEQAKTDPVPLFKLALMCRHVTNFEGDTPEEAVANARKNWQWEVTIEEFREAQVAGLIVRHGRRRNRVRKGFRTLRPAERQILEARLDGAIDGSRVPTKRRDLSIADCRNLARRRESIEKKERLQARTPFVELVPAPKVKKRKHAKWYQHPATDPITV